MCDLCQTGINLNKNYNILEITETLNTIFIRLCETLDPFPGFMGMQTIKAIELDPIDGKNDIGCIVITPEGRICELQLNVIPGPQELGGYDQTEKFVEIDFQPQEKIIYLSRAIEILSKLAFPI
jgi:hypothetical protein